MLGMKVFDRSSEYYDMIYQDKDYEKECDYIESVFRKYSALPVSRVLDIGCGTGGHAIPLARRGYKVVGVDASEAMVGKAKSKAQATGLEIDFKVKDLRSMLLKVKFDAAISMFAVMDYLIANRDIEVALENIRNVMKPGALLTFDFWNGVAVLNTKPEVRLKEVEKNGLRLIRTIEPELDILNHVSRRNHHHLVIRNGNVIEEFEELHIVRFFFPQEITHYLNSSGFEVLEFFPFLRLGEPFDEKEWDITVVAMAK